MKAIPLDSPALFANRSRPGLLDAFARRLVLRQLRRLEQGVLTIEDSGRRHVFGTHLSGKALAATITVSDTRFWGDIAFGGSIGAGEAWMQGYWQCDNLVVLVRILVRNRGMLDEMETGLARLREPAKLLFRWINRNTRLGAKRNIAAHYDLGNDFFALWLDESMMYSCAIFDDESTTLAEAQVRRLDRVCELLDLQPQDHLVEIGTGWGGMAIHAARRYGCRVTSTTISRRQCEWARRRIHDAGLDDRITVLLEDYRDLEGRFDKLVSLEMIEAIGPDQYDTYFAKCAHLLRPGGQMLIQAITIEDDRFDQYRNQVDFIQRYVFPGSCLPSERVMRETIARTGDLEVLRVDDIGLHYATTLRHWRHNFQKRIGEVRAQGYPEEFIRMWDFYLCYCEGGFLERSISDIHLVAARPGESAGASGPVTKM